jgi:MscS family membrane protein
MKQILEEIILSNSLKDYLIAFGVILLVLVLKKRASKNITRLIFYLFKKAGKKIDEKDFLDLVLPPLEKFIVFLAAYITLGELTLPELFRFQVFKIQSDVWVDRLATSVLIFLFFQTLLRVIDYLAVILEKKASGTDDPTDDQLIIFFRDFFKVVLVIICILVMIRLAFQQDITKLLAGLSLVGAAIALAAKESLENLIASFIIFFDRPFRVGDLLKVQQINGTVEKIGLRSTRIRTVERTYVSVPNKQMVDTIVDNISLRNKRRGELNLFLDLKTPVQHIESLLVDLQQCISLEEIKEKSIYLSDIRIDAYLISIEYFTEYQQIAEFNGMKQKINLRILQLLEEKGISLAGKNAVPGSKS